MQEFWLKLLSCQKSVVNGQDHKPWFNSTVHNKFANLLNVNSEQFYLNDSFTRGQSPPTCHCEESLVPAISVGEEEETFYSPSVACAVQIIMRMLRTLEQTTQKILKSVSATLQFFLFVCRTSFQVQTQFFFFVKTDDYRPPGY